MQKVNIFAVAVQFIVKLTERNKRHKSDSYLKKTLRNDC